MNENFYHCLSLAERGDHCCLELADGRRFSYRDVDKLAARAANALTARGLREGDVVSVLCEKSAELVWLYLGCLRAGLIYHPLNTGYTSQELSFFFADAGSRLVVVDPALIDTAASAIATVESPPAVLTMDADGQGDFPALIAESAETFETAANQPNDAAALLYSSGTTGTPKGIALSHRNLHVNAKALVATWQFSAEDILVHALPLYHVHGLFITLGPALLAGSCLRLLPRFDPAATVAAFRGASMMAGVPTYYTRLLSHDDFTAEAAASIRVFISGSAPLTEATFRAFRERTGHDILERYGMTETGINTSNPLVGVRKPGSVGRALPGTEVQVVDNARQALERNAIGNIEVRGENVFKGYWHLPEKTADAFSDDGWFDTGDQGFFDDDDYLHIVGRSKDMVISGGLNVYPKEIEQALDKLSGVGESAVFGVPHSDFGEAVVAAVVSNVTPEPDEKSLIAALKTALASYKVPKRITYLDELPRNAMGKVQKNRLRETFQNLFD